MEPNIHQNLTIKNVFFLFKKTTDGARKGLEWKNDIGVLEDYGIFSLPTLESIPLLVLGVDDTTRFKMVQRGIG